MTTSPQQHRILVERAAAGDANARHALWEAHRRWVAAVLLAHRPTRLELDDLMQEVAKRFLLGIETVRDPDAFRGWLRQVAINVCRDGARRDRPTWSIDRTDPAGSEDEGRPDRHHPPDPGGPADESLADQEHAAFILERIEHLPPEYREPLLLRTLRSMSCPAIAALLDLPVTTIETRLARARRMLRDELKSKES